MQDAPESLAAEVVELRALLDERDEHIAYLEKKVGIDDLTGASNRLTFTRELEQSLKVIRQEVGEKRKDSIALTQLSLISLDLDHFKKINDTYGHPVGDLVLRVVAAYLMESVRDADVVARLGGEEFMVLIRGAGVIAAERNAERFRLHFEAMKFDGCPDLRVTASFGVISSQETKDADTLINQVDKALYTAKESGRNRVVVYK